MKSKTLQADCNYCATLEKSNDFIYSHTEHMQRQKRNTLSVTVADYSLLTVIFIREKDQKQIKARVKA